MCILLSPLSVCLAHALSLPVGVSLVLAGFPGSDFKNVTVRVLAVASRE